MIERFKKWKIKPSTKNDTQARVMEEIQLIEGTFNPIEAADVLLSLVSYKIKFHNLQLLNLEGKTTEAKNQSEKRIEELKEAKKRITKLIMEARNSGTSLDIKSTISIKSMDS